MRRVVTAIIVVPLLIVLVLFAVANRQIVTIAVDPFDYEHPAFALTAPLFILIFVLIAVGMAIGGVLAWFGQRGWRARARRSESEVRALREQLSQHGAWPPGDRRAFPPASDHPAPLVFPPPA